MVDGVGGILGGLGLFFAGMWLLSENLKVLAGYRLRILATRWIPGRFAAFGWGMLAGSVVQSMTTLTFVAGSARQAGLISADRSFSIVLGGNIGTSLLVLIVAFDLEVAALCVLGAAGAAMASGWTGRYRNHATLLFGLAAVFVGLFLAKEAAAPFADHVWVGDLAEWMSYSLWFAFAGAALLAFVMQSVMPVIILGIGMTAIDVISVDQLLMIAYGAWTGSSFLLLALSANFTSASRQVAAYQLDFVHYAAKQRAYCIRLILSGGIMFGSRCGGERDKLFPSQSWHRMAAIASENVTLVFWYQAAA